jgi:hypothetical protein
MQWLSRAVVARMGGEQLALPLIALIIDRLRRINQHFAHIAARVRDGLYSPRRRSAAPQPRPGQRPPPPNPLPQKFAWLLPLVPDAVGYRSQLEHLFRDPAMAALLAAAPAPMGRALRPLCWMLGVRPPPILARPAPASPPPTEPQAAPAAQRQPKPPRQRRAWPPPTAPAWMWPPLPRSITLPHRT